MVDCRYCAQRHRPRFLCDPAKRILDALIARGMEFDMPTVDFPEPIPAHELGLGLQPGDHVLRQIVVLAGTMQVAGTPVPVVAFTGQGIGGQPLPRWLYPADEHDMRRFAELVASRIDLAVATAAGQRGR